MNRQSIINRFIEKAGGLQPIPRLNYIQGTKKGDYGMTTRLADVMKLKPSNPSTTTVEFLLEDRRYELDGWIYEFNISDILNCARCLQNSPFKDITVIRFGPKMPIAFVRSKVDISILLAPMMFEIPPDRDYQIEKRKVMNVWKGTPLLPNEWIRQLNNTTFWLVQWHTPSKESNDGMMYGYPIGSLVKCRNCGFEIGLKDYAIQVSERKHPECQCICNTFDDFCGCRYRRERMQYDRILRMSTQKMKFIRSHWDVA